MGERGRGSTSGAVEAEVRQASGVGGQAAVALVVAGVVRLLDTASGFKVYRSGFGVCGLWFGVWCVGLRVQG